MCQSSARGRCRRLRRPSLVRLIAPARHLPLPPGSSYPEPRPRGGEGRRREAPTPSYFATHRLSCRGRERGPGSAARAPAEGGEPRLAGAAGRPVLAWARPNLAQLVAAGAGSRGAAPFTEPGGSRRLFAVLAPAVTSGVTGRGAAGNARAPVRKRQQRSPPGSSGAALLSPARAYPAGRRLPPPRLRSRSRSRSDHRAPPAAPPASLRTDAPFRPGSGSRRPLGACPAPRCRLGRRQLGRLGAGGHRAAPAAPAALPRPPGYRPRPPPRAGAAGCAPARAGREGEPRARREASASALLKARAFAHPNRRPRDPSPARAAPPRCPRPLRPSTQLPFPPVPLPPHPAPERPRVRPTAPRRPPP